MHRWKSLQQAGSWCAGALRSSASARRRDSVACWGGWKAIQGGQVRFSESIEEVGGPFQTDDVRLEGSLQKLPPIVSKVLVGGLPIRCSTNSAGWKEATVMGGPAQA